MGGRHRVLHFRPRWRGQYLGLRHQDEKADASDQVHRLRRKVAGRGRGRGGIRAGRIHPRTGSQDGPHARGEYHRRGRFPVDDAALGRRDESHDEPGAFAHGQARGGGSARRSLHHPRRKRRRAQSEPLERLGGARSRVVAGRQVHLLFQRQVRRIQAGNRGPGWFDAATRDRFAESDALLHAVVVARLEEAGLYRYQPEGLGAGCRQRPGEGGGQRSVDGAGAHAESGVESRFQMGGVFQPLEVAVSRDFRQQCRDGRDQAGDGRAGRRGVACLGCGRQVSVVSRLDGLRLGVAMAGHDLLRPR